MKEQNETRFPGAALLVIPFALMSAWYLNYAFHGWFQQDDFGSIYLYQHSLHTSNLWNFNDFGRFLSRNLYWHFLWQIFGAQAAYYFLFNFLTIAGTTFVIFRTFRATYDRAISATVALLYFGSINVVEDYSWISFSQHLIPIFFIFLFMGMFIDRVEKEWTGTDAFKMIAVLALGISGNIFAIGALVFPLYFALRNKELRRDRKFRFFVVLAVLGSLIALVEAHRFAVGPYATSFSWSVVHGNLTYYFQNHLWEYVLALAIMLIVGWRRENHYVTTVALLCIASFAPYAILVSQRSQGYMSLTSTTFFMGLLLTAIELFGKNKPIRNTLLTLAVLTPFYFVNPSPLNNYWNANPQGATAHGIVTQVSAFADQHPEIKTYCFGAQIDGIGAKIATRDWAFLAKGKALSDFIASSDKFRFYPRGYYPTSCQAIIILTKNPSLVFDNRN